LIPRVAASCLWIPPVDKGSTPIRAATALAMVDLPLPISPAIEILVIMARLPTR
jgi:hypothetical protein